MKTRYEKKHIVNGLVSMLVLGIVSCSDSWEDSLWRNNTLPISIEAGYPTFTRATDDGFIGGDAIGIYVVDYDGEQSGTLQTDGNRGDNIRFTLDDESWTWKGAANLYFKDDRTPVDIYGYYPFAEKVDDVTAYPFAVQTDQNRAAKNGVMAGYEASDLLWAKSERVQPTTNVIPLKFQHLLSCLHITLTKGAGFADEEWNQLEKAVLIPGTRQNALVNLAKGEVTVLDDVGNSPIVAYQDGTDFRAIVIPQTMEAGKTLVSLTVGGCNYELVKTESVAYTSGKKHKFTIKVDKKNITGDYSFTLVDESVSAWLEDPRLHDGLVREYMTVNVAEPGQLAAAIAAKGWNAEMIGALKVTGLINRDDFNYMRDNMTSLVSINLKNVRIKKIDDGGDTKDDAIPEAAFNSKKLLSHFVFPDNLKIIGFDAFYGTHLVGALIIPEGVVAIESGAFYGITSLGGALSLPSTLQKIGISAFSGCSFTSELMIPLGVTAIGEWAFNGCKEMKGVLALPSGLEEISSNAFCYMRNMSGDIVIPQGVKKISHNAFGGSGFDGNIEIPEGVELIADGAFSNLAITGELKLPHSLKKIGGGNEYHMDDPQGAFSNTLISGRLILPEGLIGINAYSFKNCSRLSGTLEIPSTVPSIGKEAFYGCTGIEELVLHDGLQVISSGAFGLCSGLNSIISYAKIPPSMDESTFDGVANNLSVEVPKGCVEAYRIAPGWKDFARISEYRGFVCRPLALNALNKEHVEEIILNADGDWTVEHIPDWCSISQTSGSSKTPLKVTFKQLPAGQGNRTDNIVFKLTDGDYTTQCKVSQYDCQYAEDEVVTLQRATKGKGIDILFMGDGFDAASIANGSYMDLIKEQYGHFFDIVPYSTYKDYFNVYAAVALSQETAVNTLNTYSNTKFNTIYGGCDAKLIPDARLVTSYALNSGAIKKDRLEQSLLIVVPNSTAYGSSTYYYDDGTTISVCSPSESAYPNDTRGIIQHEAGGHGYGKLADERIVANAFFKAKDVIYAAHRKGWYQNVSPNGNISEVPWAHLIFDERYSDIVDIFEGACGYTRGVFRSESNSCMNCGIPYYNTISRQSIVKRILEDAGEVFTMEKFFEKDSRAWGGNNATRSVNAPWQGYAAQGSHKMPTFVHECPSKKR